LGIAEIADRIVVGLAICAVKPSSASQRHCRYHGSAVENATLPV
jgi:hypothetical protein